LGGTLKPARETRALPEPLRLAPGKSRRAFEDGSWGKMLITLTKIAASDSAIDVILGILRWERSCLTAIGNRAVSQTFEPLASSVIFLKNMLANVGGLRLMNLSFSKSRFLSQNPSP